VLQVIISRKSQKLVLKLKDPARVTTVIPSAKAFDYHGMTMVSVPHNVAETRVLRNLGINAPSPTEYHYDWSGEYKPFHAQRETAGFLSLNPRAFVLSDMGTGKTLSTLWAFDYLRSIGMASKMLVISPLSTLERTWADEVFRHFPHLQTSVLHGASARRQKMLDLDADIYLINHDGVKVMQDALVARTDIDTIVIDEIASFRNARTGRWRSLNAVCRGRERLWGLTGTPTPNAPTDAWAQCRIISPERVPKFFGRFQDAVTRKLGPFKTVARDDATTIVHDAMQPAIRFTMDDCIDLPECVYVEREVPMTKEQALAYKTMAAKLVMELGTSQVVAVNEAVKMSKLVQIACGVVYGTDGEEVILDNDHRIAVVREAIEEAGTKTIVFVPYKSVLRRVAEQLSADYEVCVISGDVSKSDRDAVFSAFQNDKSGPRVLVAQPAAMSHGLTLTAASTILWYAPVTSNETYQQANARISRPGQKHSQLIVNVSGSPVERKIYQRLRQKQSMQGLLLEAVHG